MSPKHGSQITRKQREITQLRKALRETADVQSKVLRQPPEEPMPEEPVIDSNRFVGLPRQQRSLLVRIALGMKVGDSKGLNDSITKAVDEGINVHRIGDAMIEGIHSWFPSIERDG